MREVVPSEGVVLPNGYRVLKGTWIGVPTAAIQMDEGVYERPDVFDPWRYVREWEGKGEDGGGRFDASQPTERFLGFSYGKHAWLVMSVMSWVFGVMLICGSPGRWFAIQVLSLLIAYVAVHYDVEPIGKRPVGMVFGDANVPSMSTTMRVRRRKSVDA